MNRKSGRASGGIALLYKTAYFKHVKVLKIGTNVIWFRMQKQVFGSAKDIVFGSIYIPPENSSYFKQEHIDNLETDLALFFTAI